MFTQLKISSKIIILILSLVTLTVVLESLVSYVENKEVIKKGTIDKFNVINKDNEEKISEYFDNVFVGLNAYIEQPYFKSQFKLLNSKLSSDPEKDSIRTIFKKSIFPSIKNNFDFENIYILNQDRVIVFDYKNNSTHNEEFRNLDNQLIDLTNRKNNVNPVLLEDKKFCNYITIPIITNDGHSLLICKIDICKILKKTAFKNYTPVNSFVQIAYKANDNDNYFFDCTSEDNGLIGERNYSKGNFSTQAGSKIGKYNEIYQVGSGEFLNESQEKIIASWRHIPKLGIGLLVQQKESDV